MKSAKDAGLDPNTWVHHFFTNVMIVEWIDKEGITHKGSVRHIHTRTFLSDETFVPWLGVWERDEEGRKTRQRIDYDTPLSIIFYAPVGECCVNFE